MPSDPPISFESALRAEVRTNVVCMLCPSNGDVLATPLTQTDMHDIFIQPDYYRYTGHGLSFTVKP